MEIALLGGCRIRVGSSVVSVPAKKAQALLAYLAMVPGQPCERERIGGLLWGEFPTALAQANLRQTLFVLRRALPVSARAALLAGRTTLALDRSRVQVDVALMETRAEDQTLEGLEVVAALYNGPLLEGFTLDEPSFDAWLRVERARLSELAMRALDRLAELHENAGAVERCVQTSQQLLRLDATRESTHRRLMRLYAGQGRRADALGQYRLCADALKREFDVEPDDATKAMVRSIRGVERVSVPRGPARAAPKALSPPPPLPLVGREPELGRLREAIDAAREGAGQLVVLDGEAGVGKTRLLDEAAAWAEAHGIRVLRGRCFESEQILPFVLWSDLLQDQSDVSSDARWSSLPPAWRVEISRLLPRPGEPRQAAPPDPQQALPLFEAMGGLFAHVALDAPLLIVLEDLHWADAMSLRLVSFVARRVAPASRIAIMASVRTEHRGSTPFLRTILEELEREGLFVAIPVAPLSRADTTALVRSLTPECDSERTFDAIWASSEGNPLVVVELLRTFEQGVLGDSVGHLPVPARIRELIASHVSRLPPLGQEIVATASIIGREFEFDLLKAACTFDDRDLVAALEALVGMRVLRRTRDSRREGLDDGFYFAHDRFREVVYEGLLPARRRVLHGAVGRALERLCVDRLDDASGRLGYHYARAGEAVRSVAYLRRFADRCVESYGLEEALAALRQALCQIEMLPAPVRDETAVAIADCQAQCLFFLGRFAEVEPTLVGHQASVERLDSPAVTASFHARLALAHCYLGERRLTEKHGERALAAAERCRDAGIAGAVHAALSHNALYSAEFRRGIEHGLKAVATLEPMPDQVRHLGAGLQHLAGNYLSIGDWRRALDVYRRANALAEAAHLVSLQAQTFAALGLVHFTTLDAEAALAFCVRAVDLAPDPFSTVWASWVVARVWSALGRAHEGACSSAVDVLEAAVRRPDGPRGWDGLARIALAEAYLARGEPKRARVTALEALRAFRAACDRQGEGWALRALGQSEHAVGDTRGARERLMEARGIFDSIGGRIDLAWTAFRLGVVTLEAGDPAGAAHVGEAHRIFSDLGLVRSAALTAQAL